MTSLLEQPGYDEEKLQMVAEQLLCREDQAGLLLSLMGQVLTLVLVFLPLLSSFLLSLLGPHALHTC